MSYPPPLSTLFPYTTLFRSGAGAHALGEDHRGGQLGLELLGLRREAVDRGVDNARADGQHPDADRGQVTGGGDRKSTRLNSSHMSISYAVFCLKKKKKIIYV